MTTSSTLPTVTLSSTSSTIVGASPFALTTTFIPPPACTENAFTLLENRQFEIWYNEINPVPGTTITSCYPSEIVSSYQLQIGGISQAAFNLLICPLGYETQGGPYTSNYIACCPSGWMGVHPNPNAPEDRPAYLGTCFTDIYNVPLTVTAYGSSYVTATSIYIDNTDSSGQAYASVFEGFAYGVAVLPSITGSSSLTSTTSTSSSLPLQSQTSVLSSSGMSDGGIAGAVIGSIVGAIALLLALFFFLRTRHAKSRNTVEFHPGDISESRSQISTYGGPKMPSSGVLSISTDGYSSRDRAPDPGRYAGTDVYAIGEELEVQERPQEMSTVGHEKEGVRYEMEAIDSPSTAGKR